MRRDMRKLLGMKFVHAIITVLLIVWLQAVFLIHVRSNFRQTNFMLVSVLLAVLRISNDTTNISHPCALHQCVKYFLMTYAIMSWWCRMHAFNLACKSLFAVLLSSAPSCLWEGVMCSCLISNKVAFSFWNWAQPTAIRAVHRDRKP
jgi:hypothetical protein